MSPGLLSVQVYYQSRFIMSPGLLSSRFIISLGLLSVQVYYQSRFIISPGLLSV